MKRLNLSERGFFARMAMGVCVVLLAGCEAPVTQQAGAPNLTFAETQANNASIETKIAKVTKALLELGQSVDPQDAARAARIAVQEPLVWAQEWNVVDAPYWHNVKVVNGYREKGVCQDWANALEIALSRAGLKTLELHRALANARNVQLEHATLIVTARGQKMQQGLILDPWRIGQGRLWFGRVAEDHRYTWESREAIHAWQRALKAQQSAGG